MSKKIVSVVIIVLIVLSLAFFGESNEIVAKIMHEEQVRMLEKEIKAHYGKTVIVNKDAKIYTYNSEYTPVGTIKKGEVITLISKNITYQDIYFEIQGFDDKYYINYHDVIPSKDSISYESRYKKYIPFNENVVTNHVVNFYDDDKLVYILNKQFSLPIIAKYDFGYGVDYNNKLLIIKNEDVEKIIKNNNSDLVGTEAIAVLNYHFFYDETKESERKDCDQIICLSRSSFMSHLNYFKDNDILTLTMEEYEMWYDKQINLPKSVLITIDDGWRMNIGIDLLEEYKLNGTVFLITSWFKEVTFLHDYEYVEFHSHGDKLHDQGVCPGGQGGAIKCVEKTKLLADLTLSRKKLDNTTYFCYPFYEYNDYAINILKEAGFTMAFALGERSTRNSNRYAIPRYVIYSYTTIDNLKKYIG